MRRVKPDVSHRIRRQPSIFSVRWFRIALGLGLVLVLALLVGPSVTGWFRGDLPNSAFLLVPGGGPAKTAESTTPDSSSARPTVPPTATPSAPSAAPGTASASSAGKSVVAPIEGAPASPPTVGSSSPAPSAPSTTTATSPVPRETAKAAPAASDGATPRPGSLSSPPSVYWIQVGAFLDHKNADRLTERLKSDGLSAATTSFEQSRVMYRVLLTSADGGRVPDDAVERVKGLGHPVEATADGPAVTGLVPLRKAVETSHALRQQGIPVRLKQEVSSSTFRVVRVGSFATVAEAETALAALSAKGVEGVVVREH